MRTAAALKEHRPLVTLLAIWLLWAVILSGFQELVAARLKLAPPDTALFWTPNETAAHSQDGKPYLNEPFLNTHVSWDSEYYLSIATVGYDDARVGHIGGGLQGPPPGVAVVGGPPPGVLRPSRPPGGAGQAAGGAPPGYNTSEGLAKNYAFMPLYPYLVRVAALPLGLFRLNAIATSALAGTVVSILGALAAMWALYDLTREELGEEGGVRTAFYLLIFPTGFFLAQVYTEGLFVGLAFASLALLRRKHWLAAAILAAGATLTRAVGLGLVLPFGWALWREVRDPAFGRTGLPWRTVLHAALAALPAAVFLLWQNSTWGQSFLIVERDFFQRGLFLFDASLKAWQNGWNMIWSSNSQARVYYALEFAAIMFGAAASLVEWRRRPDIAMFSLAVVVVSVTSGVAQGMLRYILAAPAVFTVLSRWGRHQAFDRCWSLASILVMSMSATLFTFDFWAG